MSISKLRSIMYFLSKLLGDYSAVKRGRVKERLWNRIVGKLTGRLMR